MKLSISHIFLATILLASCAGIYLKTQGKTSVTTSGLAFKGGFISIDSSDNFRYIPDALNKDTVYGKVMRISENKYWFKSEFQKNKISKVSYYFSGKSIKDSVEVFCNNATNDYPIGFVSIDFINQDTIRQSFLSKVRIAKSDLKQYRIDVLATYKSDLMTINDDEIRDTMHIIFEYLRVRRIPKYTFISDTLEI